MINDSFIDKHEKYTNFLTIGLPFFFSILYKKGKFATNKNKKLIFELVKLI